MNEKNVADASNLVNRRRSERVMLRVRILVSAEDTEHKRQQEEAITQVVNAHGGLMKMKMEAACGAADDAPEPTEQGAAKL